MPSAQKLVLPDLIGLVPFPCSGNPHSEQAGAESVAWIDRYDVFRDSNRATFMQLRGNVMVSRGYPFADLDATRICCDVINLLFLLDEVSDEQDGAGARQTGYIFLKAMSDEPCDGSLLSRMTKEFVAIFLGRGEADIKLISSLKERLEHKTGPNFQRRFVQHCANYLEAVWKEADLRDRGEVLDLEAYTNLRRENSGVRPCFSLFEYTLGIDLPDEVFEDPVFASMYFGAIDMVFWSNVSSPLRVFSACTTSHRCSGPLFIQRRTSEGNRRQQRHHRHHEGS